MQVWIILIAPKQKCNLGGTITICFFFLFKYIGIWNTRESLTCNMRKLNNATFVSVENQIEIKLENYYHLALVSSKLPTTWQYHILLLHILIIIFFCGWGDIGAESWLSAEILHKSYHINPLLSTLCGLPSQLKQNSKSLYWLAYKCNLHFHLPPSCSLLQFPCSSSQTCQTLSYSRILLFTCPLLDHIPPDLHMAHLLIYFF